MKRTLASLAAFALALSTSVAVAQPNDFDAADSNDDGSVSLIELQTLFPNVTEEDFARADADGSGELSVEEYDLFVSSGARGSGSSDNDGDAASEPAN